MYKWHKQRFLSPFILFITWNCIQKDFILLIIPIYKRSEVIRKQVGEAWWSHGSPRSRLQIHRECCLIWTILWMQSQRSDHRPSRRPIPIWADVKLISLPAQWKWRFSQQLLWFWFMFMITELPHLSSLCIWQCWSWRCCLTRPILYNDPLCSCQTPCSC